MEKMEVPTLHISNSDVQAPKATNNMDLMTANADENVSLSFLVSVLECNPSVGGIEGTVAPLPTAGKQTTKVAPKPRAKKQVTKRKLGELDSSGFGNDLKAPKLSARTVTDIDSNHERSGSDDGNSGSIQSADGEKLVATDIVLSYANCIMKSFNEGKLPTLEAEINRICADDCVLRTQIFKTADGAPFANRIVPRERIYEFFCASLDSVPDGLFRPLNSKLISNGKHRSVASNFRFSGTMIRAVHDAEVEAKFENTDPIGAIELRDARPLGSFMLQCVGTFVLTLNSTYKVSMMEITYRAKIEKN